MEEAILAFCISHMIPTHPGNKIQESTLPKMVTKVQDFGFGVIQGVGADLKPLHKPASLFSQKRISSTCELQ